MQYLGRRQETVAISQLAVPTAGHFLGDVAELEVGLGKTCHVVGEVLGHAIEPKFVPSFKKLVGFGSVCRKHHAPVKDFVVQNRRKAHHLRIVQNLLAVDGFRKIGVEVQHRVNAPLPFFGNGEVAHDGDVGIHIEKVAVDDIAHHRLEVAGTQHGRELFV